MAPAGGPWTEAERVLVLRLDNLGDLVMLSPALRALRAALPDAEVTLMASPTGARVVPLLPWVDRVMDEVVVWQALGACGPPDPGREQALVGRIADGRFDMALIFTSFSQSPLPAGYACLLAGVAVRVGQSKEFGGGVLSHELASPPDECHQVDRNLALLEAIGVPVAARHLELVVPGDVRAGADRLLAAVGLAPGEPFVALAPGASAPARRYDPRRFAAVARALVDDVGLPVVVVGSPGDQALAAEVIAASGGSDGAVSSLCGQTSVPELAAVVARARLVVSNDSGCMHLADAFARPVVVTFAGTDLESQWGPSASPSRLLRRPTWCAPCYEIECPYARECLDIDPAEVLAAAATLLEMPGPAGGHAVAPAPTPHTAPAAAGDGSPVDG